MTSESTELADEMARLSGLHILVVEDMLLVAEVICEQLESCGCIVVGPAARVGRALVLAREEPLDGALLDVNLAGESSFPVAAALDARNIPYVFLTGYDDAAALPPEYRKLPKLGKPFRQEALIRAAAEHFHREG